MKERGLEEYRDKCEALYGELLGLVQAIARREAGNASVESLYEFAALNFPHEWLTYGPLPRVDA